MRERSRSSGGIAGQTAHLAQSRAYNVPTWNSVTEYTTYYSPIVYEQMSDVVTAGYERKIAAGEIINNPMSKTVRTTTTPGPTSFSHRRTAIDNYGEYGFVYSGSIVPFGNWFANVLPPILEVGVDLPAAIELRANVLNEAVTSAHANVNESEMLALASMAESRKTVESMASILYRVVRIARAVRKLNFNALRKELTKKELANRYMELRYALRPMIIDAASLLNSFEKTRCSVRKTYRGFSKGSLEISDSLGYQRSAIQTETEVNRKLTYTVSARAGVLCDVTIDSITVFGIDRLAESLWELVPFSFIVDWFANVGDTIAALTPNHGVNERASWVTIKEHIVSTNSSGASRALTTWPVNESSLGYFQYGEDELVVQRVANPIVSVWPQSKLRLDGFKLLDLGIIARQILS